MPSGWQPLRTGRPEAGLCRPGGPTFPPRRRRVSWRWLRLLDIADTAGAVSPSHSDRHRPHILDGAGPPHPGDVRARAFARSDRIVFQTQGALDYYAENIQRKGVIIGNPLREGLIHNPAPFETREKEVVSFGRLIPQKRPDVLINAFCTVPRAAPRVSPRALFGEGPLADAVRGQIEALGLSDSVALSPYREDIHDRVRNAAMYVLSSDVEGLPNSMLEAMTLASRAYALTAPRGARETIERFDSGVLVPAGDPAALANAMTALANDPEQANALIAAGAPLGELLSGERILPGVGRHTHGRHCAVIDTHPTSGVMRV